MPSLSRIRNFDAICDRPLVGFSLLGLTTVGHDDIKYPIHTGPVVCPALASVGGRLPARVCQPSSPTTCSQSEVFSPQGHCSIAQQRSFVTGGSVYLAMLQQFDRVLALYICLLGSLFARDIDCLRFGLTELIQHPRAYTGYPPGLTCRLYRSYSGSLPVEAKTKKPGRVPYSTCSTVVLYDPATGTPPQSIHRQLPGISSSLPIYSAEHNPIQSCAFPRGPAPLFYSTLPPSTSLFCR